MSLHLFQTRFETLVWLILFCAFGTMLVFEGLRLVGRAT